MNTIIIVLFRISEDVIMYRLFQVLSYLLSMHVYFIYLYSKIQIVRIKRNRIAHILVLSDHNFIVNFCTYNTIHTLRLK